MCFVASFGGIASTNCHDSLSGVSYVVSSVWLCLIVKSHWCIIDRRLCCLVHLIVLMVRYLWKVCPMFSVVALMLVVIQNI